MGAEKSTEKQKEYQKIRDEYIVLRELKHSTLGEITVIKHNKTGELAAIKNAQANSEDEHKDFIESFKKRS